MGFGCQVQVGGFMADTLAAFQALPAVKNDRIALAHASLASWTIEGWGPSGRAERTAPGGAGSMPGAVRLLQGGAAMWMRVL